MERTEADAIAYHSRKPLPGDGPYGHVIALPKEDGWELRDLTPYARTPDSRCEDLCLYTWQSLVAYANKHGDQDSLILCAEKPRFSSISRIECILDHHGDSDDKARPGRHRCRVLLNKTRQMMAWEGANNSWLGQAKFTEFIDDNSADIAEPASASILEMIRSLEATSSKTFSQDIDLQDGKHVLKLSSEQKVRSRIDGVEIPKRMLLRMPVYAGGGMAEFEARLHRKVNDDGRLLLRYVMPRHDDIVSLAFQTVVSDIRQALTIGCLVLEGER